MADTSQYQGIHAELTDKIIKAFYLVSNELGFGFLESVYQKAMLVALGEAGLQAETEVKIPVSFHGRRIGDFSADILVESKIILELKTAEEVSRSAQAQLLNYLRATSIEVGLILAFGEKANLRRLILTNDRKPNLRRS